MTVQDLIDFLSQVEDKSRTVAIEEGQTWRVLDTANCLDRDIFDGHVVLG